MWSAAFPAAQPPRGLRSTLVPASAGKGEGLDAALRNPGSRRPGVRGDNRVGTGALRSCGNQLVGLQSGCQPKASVPSGGGCRTRQSARRRQLAARWTTHRPGVCPTRNVVRGHCRCGHGSGARGAIRARYDPKDLMFRGQPRDLRSGEGVRRHGLRVHAPGAFFFFSNILMHHE